MEEKFENAKFVRNFLLHWSSKENQLHHPAWQCEFMDMQIKHLGRAHLLPILKKKVFCITTGTLKAVPGLDVDTPTNKGETFERATITYN